MITELIFEFGFSGSFLFTPFGTRAGFLARRLVALAVLLRTQTMIFLALGADTLA
jgi:hypothetical protein